MIKSITNNEQLNLPITEEGTARKLTMSDKHTALASVWKSITWIRIAWNRTVVGVSSVDHCPRKIVCHSLHVCFLLICHYSVLEGQSGQHRMYKSLRIKHNDPCSEWRLRYCAWLPLLCTEPSEWPKKIAVKTVLPRVPVEIYRYGYTMRPNEYQTRRPIQGFNVGPMQ